MKKTITIFVTALLSSCATLFTGGKARVALNTPKTEELL